MRHDFINDPPVSVYIFDFQLVVVIFQSQQQRKMFKGFLKPQARLLVQVHEAKNKREDASTSGFLVHRSVFCTYKKTRVVGCKLKRQIGWSKRQETMYRKQLNWTGKQFGLSKQFKFSRRMIIPFSSICLSANWQYVYLKLLRLQSKPSKKRAWPSFWCTKYSVDISLISAGVIEALTSAVAVTLLLKRTKMISILKFKTCVV